MVTANDSENKLSKIQWRCRRGMLELDMMLQNFCEQTYPSMSPEKQMLFEDLLECEDQDLHSWLIGAKPTTDPRFQDLILVIRHMHAKATHGQPA